MTPLMLWLRTAVAPLASIATALSQSVTAVIAPAVTALATLASQLGAAATFLLGPPARLVWALLCALHQLGTYLVLLGRAFAAGPMYVLLQLQGFLAGACAAFMAQLQGLIAALAIIGRALAAGGKVRTQVLLE